MKNTTTKVITRSVSYAAPQYSLLEQYREAALFKHIIDNFALEINGPEMRQFPWMAKIVGDCIRLGTLVNIDECVTITDKGQKFYDVVASKVLEVGYTPLLKIIKREHSELRCAHSAPVVLIQRRA